MRHSSSLVLMVGMALAFGQALFASVVYSNFGSPGSLYQPGAGATVSGYTTVFCPCVGEVAQAFAFIPDANYRRTSVDIAFSIVSGVNQEIIELWTDNGGVPGRVLSPRCTSLPHPSADAAISFQQCLILR